MESEVRQLMGNKKTWPCKDVAWCAPERKRPIAYSTTATKNWIDLLTGYGMTIREMYDASVYDEDARDVLQAYIDKGFENKSGQSLGFEGSDVPIAFADWLEASNPFNPCDGYRPGKTYVCYPYSGDPEKSQKVCADVARRLVDAGWRVFAPQIYFHQFIDEDTDREKALNHCLMELDECEVLLVVGDTLTDGMAAEIDRAIDNHLLIVRVREEEEWAT